MEEQNGAIRFDFFYSPETLAEAQNAAKLPRQAHEKRIRVSTNVPYMDRQMKRKAVSLRKRKAEEMEERRSNAIDHSPNSADAAKDHPGHSERPGNRQRTEEVPSISGKPAVGYTIHPGDQTRWSKPKGTASFASYTKPEIRGTKAAGIALHINQKLRPVEIPVSNENTVAAQIKAPNDVPWLIVSCYVSKQIKVRTMRELKELATRWARSHPECPIAILGDFNKKTPHERLRQRKWHLCLRTSAGNMLSTASDYLAVRGSAPV